MPDGALAGLRVVECGGGVAAAYASKLLADLGAEVTKVESPQGDYTRQRGPFPGAVPNREASGMFMYLNAGKRSVTLDLTSREGAQGFEQFLHGVDALIHNFTPHSAARRVVEPDRLLTRHPRLVIADITGFGRGGPHTGYEWTNLIALCAGGLAFISAPERNRPDKEPIVPHGEQAEFQAACTAAVAIMGALHARRQTGKGQWIDVSAQEVIASILGVAIAAYTYTHVVPSRLGVRSIHPWAFMECRDGMILIFCVENDQWQRLVELLGSPEWAEWPIFNDRFDRAQNWDVLQPLLAELVRPWGVRELYEEGQRRRIPLAPVATMADLLASPQLAYRKYFVPYESPETGRFLLPGRPYTLSATPWALYGPAPALAEERQHSVADGSRQSAVGSREGIEEAPTRVAATRTTSPSTVPAAAHGASMGTEATTTADSRLPTAAPHPLQNVRVLDFTWVWAGPYCAMQLAHLGAEVIKIESQRRLDTTRRFVPFAEEEPGVNRSGYFNQYNQGKRSVLLNLTEPAWRQIAQQLAATADIVIDNYAPGAMERFGLDYKTLRQINPGIITMSLSGYGADGPESRFISYGPSQEPLTGLSALSGYRNGPPGDLGLSYGDPNAGIHAAFAVLAALWHREQTGEGQQIDVSLFESSINVIPEGIISQTMNGFPPPRMGDRDRWMSPHNIFRCVGDDAWVGIAVRNDEEFVRFAGAIGRPELARDPRFATLHARKANEDDLEAIVGAWTIERDRFAVTTELQRAGVPAFACMTVEDLLNDPHLAARDFFVKLEHREVGVRAHAGIPWRMSGTPLRVRSPAPLLGEGTDYALHDLLGLASSEVERLREACVLY